MKGWYLELLCGIFAHLSCFCCVFKSFILVIPPKNSIFVIKTCENSSCVLLAPATKKSTQNIEKGREKEN